MYEERKIVPGDFYRHFKNKLYQIKEIAYDSETNEKMVVYQALYGEFATYVRPYDSFISEVDHNKYTDVKQKYRFERVELQQQDNTLEQEDKILHTEVSLQNDAVSYNDKEEAAQIPDSLEGVPDPRLIMFLDADSLQEKLNVLTLLRDKLDDRLINDMAVSFDIEVPEGPIDKRYESLRSCIMAHAKYECSRLR